MTRFAKAEREAVNTRAAYDQAIERQRHQKRHVSILNENRADALAANELILEARAEAMAEGRAYDGTPLMDVHAIDAEIDQANRVLVKMGDVAKAKGRAMQDAHSALLVAQRRIAVDELERRGFPFAMSYSPEKFADLTLGELIEIAALRFVASHQAGNGVIRSLRALLRRFDEPNWSKISAVERAFAAARKGAGTDAE